MQYISIVVRPNQKIQLTILELGVMEDRILPLPKSFPTMMTGYPIAWIHLAKKNPPTKIPDQCKI
uniref:Uncharacterized protein n=1 Tax=Romanomermis culicivorax TaxID=13658 RepID=A0A915IKM1_ROMCU